MDWRLMKILDHDTDEAIAKDGWSFDLIVDFRFASMRNMFRLDNDSISVDVPFIYSPSHDDHIDVMRGCYGILAKRWANGWIRKAVESGDAIVRINGGVAPMTISDVLHDGQTMTNMLVDRHLAVRLDIIGLESRELIHAHMLNMFHLLDFDGYALGLTHDDGKDALDRMAVSYGFPRFDWSH